MLTLYDYLPSQNAWKVRLLLSHLQQPYSRKLISIFEQNQQQKEYLSVSPTGAVPAIELSDGNIIFESNAILVYLAEGTKYFPTDAIKRAQVMQWLFFEADSVQSSIATLRHWTLTGKDKARSKQQIANMMQSSRSILSMLDTKLETDKFLIGEEYTIADISVFAYVHLAEDAGLSMNNYRNVMRWIKDVRGESEIPEEVFPYSIDEHSVNEL